MERGRDCRHRRIENRGVERLQEKRHGISHGTRRLVEVVSRVARTELRSDWAALYS